MRCVDRGRRALWLAVLLVVATMASGQEEAAEDRGSATTYGAEIELEWAADRDQTQKLLLQVEPTLESWSPSGWRLFVRGRMRSDRYDRLDPDQPRELTSSAVSQRAFLGDRTELELREAFLEKAFGPHLVSLGKQQVVWGQADGFKVLDVVNPQDFREWILEDFEDSRIPTWMLRTELALGSSQLQLLVIPDRTRHRFSGVGGVFSPAELRGLEGLEFEVEESDRTSERVELGARYSALVGGWDLSLNALWHAADTPLVLPDAAAGVATLRYPWSLLSGVTLSNAFGPMTLRLELAHQGRRELQGLLVREVDGDPLAVSDVAETAGVVGLDFSLSDRHWLSFQLFERRRDLEQTAAAIPDRDAFATVVSRSNFAAQRVQLELQWLAGLDVREGLGRLMLDVELRTDLRVFLGVDVFYGDERGLLGRFEERDRLRFGLRAAL